MVLWREILVIPPLWALSEGRGRCFSCLAQGRRSFTLHTVVLGVCKASIGAWPVEMMVVATMCCLRSSAELPWICPFYLVIPASKEIFPEVFLIRCYCIFLGSTVSMSHCWPVVWAWWEKCLLKIDCLCSYSPYSSRAHLKHDGGPFLVPLNSEECELLISFGYFVSFLEH